MALPVVSVIVPMMSPVIRCAQKGCDEAIQTKRKIPTPVNRLPMDLKVINLLCLLLSSPLLQRAPEVLTSPRPSGKVLGRSKLQLQRKLDDSRGTGNGHLPELPVHLLTAGIEPGRAIHRLELRVVKRVEQLRLELQALWPRSSAGNFSPGSDPSC